MFSGIIMSDKVVKKKKGRKDPFKDDRFTYMLSESKFNYTLPKKEIKTTIDKRFRDALKDERFQNRAKVDMYGRAAKKKNEVAEDIAAMYHMEDEEEEDEERDSEKVKEESEEGEENTDGESAGEDEEEEHAEGVVDEDDTPIRIDLARGDVDILSSSDDDSDDEDDVKEEDIVPDNWAELDKDARRVEWSSRRLAVCNLDWDHLCSEDLFILCKSFLPPGGCLKHLTIYLSDFGKERMEEEDRHGPNLMRGGVNEDDEEEEQTEEKQKEANEKVRQYELDRLKYYYALLECESAEAATAIYEACDGHEFENSGLRMDMRFVPDEMRFEKDRIKERISNDELNEDKYKPKTFVAKASSMTKAEITWDETNPNRVRKFQAAFDDPQNMNARDLIACSESEEESDEEEKDERIQSLLSAAGINRKSKELEVQWDAPAGGGSGEDSDKDEEGSEEGDEVEEDSEEAPKKKKSWVEFLSAKREKRVERKRQLKEERKEQKQERTEQPVPKKKKKAAKALTDKETEAVVGDDRFKALFTDDAFAIEHTNKEFKDTKLVEKQVAARKERHTQMEKAAVKEKTEEGGSSREMALIEKLKKKSETMQKKKKMLL